MCGMLAAGPGLSLIEHRRAAPDNNAGPPQPQPMQHTIFLTDYHANTPALDKVSRQEACLVWLAKSRAHNIIGKFTILTMNNVFN